jgi:hypothetical protein
MASLNPQVANAVEETHSRQSSCCQLWRVPFLVDEMKT